MVTYNMEFEWNEDKRQSNIRDHGVDFVGVTQLFDGRPVFRYATPRNDGEPLG